MQRVYNVPLLGEFTVSNTFVVLACFAMLAQAIIIVVALFGPSPKYKITMPGQESVSSDQFVWNLEAITDAKLNHSNKLDVFTNGDQFYEAELAAIRSAKKNVNIEAYIFQEGEIAKRFVDALTERARAGVQVRLVLDGLGSLGTTDSYFGELKKAGGKFAWYHPVRWNTLPRYNNRTHRELMVIDGTVGFIGGAGIADHWYKQTKKDQPRWRDTMVRVEGDVVPNLQATFAENWLESCGELIAGPAFFPIIKRDQAQTAMIVNSMPSAGGSTRARVLMQSLIASAHNSILITTPYFLPDESMKEELIRARNRGVQVKIIAPGHHSDHMVTRSSSQRSYGKLLEAGIQIFEYQPAMIHAKILIVDDVWSVVGSTNFDNRSFGLNDEVNLAVYDHNFANRLEEDFARDLSNSRQITYDEWAHRPFWQRGTELFGWVIERQQ
ncbi:MAG TPA: cardiolipin synthase [Terriglobales bacterium]|nr:cardiolipin synthase [Terriglobales bacterium]